MTKNKKTMLRKLIVKEDELEESQMRLDRTPSNVGWMSKALLESKVTRLATEIEELREKLKELCEE